MDVSDLKKQVETLLHEHGIKQSSKSGEDESVYIARMNGAVMKITISSRWLGYDLSLPDSLFGHKAGASLDTDNYALDFDIDATRCIFNETLACLKGLLEGRIYTGRIDSYPVLAIPTSDTEYKITMFNFRTKWWHLFESSKTTTVPEEQLKLIANRKPLG